MIILTYERSRSRVSGRRSPSGAYTTSMSLSLDYARPLECDVAIAGAELAGLVAGAILSRHGLRVVLVDTPSQVGGRGGGTSYRGYWLDGGQRDGLDVTDLQIGWRYGQLAARAADVDVPLRVVPPAVRVHLLDTFPPASAPATVIDGDWSAQGFAAMARDAFGCPQGALPDFMKSLGRLAAATPEERRSQIPIPFSDWLEAHVRAPEVRRALLVMVAVIFCEHPERASSGRIMSFLAVQGAKPPLVAAYADHDEAGGMQGLMLPWARAIESRGGRIVLGHKPSEVTFSGSRATGLIALSQGHLALEIRSHATLVCYPLWHLPQLLPSGTLPPSWTELARKLENEQADAIAWQAGLRRLPRLRATGQPDTHLGWNRLLVGPERRFQGGFHFPSLGSRRSAPDGRHLLHASVSRWLKREERVPWSQSRATLEGLRDYLRQHYLDLDDCVEWSVYQHIERPALLAWYWSCIERHGVRVPGCEGLYLASTTFESDAGPVDIAAHAGLEAARSVLADSGHGSLDCEPSDPPGPATGKAGAI